MELYQLEYFRVIADTQNLQEASRRLHVSQPSLSRCIKALEEELDTPLFDRIGRVIVLNEAGQIMLQRANATLDSAASIKREVHAFVRDREQIINLFAPVPLGDDEALLFNFKKEHPQIRIRIGCAPAERLMDEVPDMTFFASPIIHKEPNYLMLGEEQFVLAAPKNSFFAQQGSVRLADLGGLSFIKSMPCACRDIVESMFYEAGIEPHVILETQSLFSVMNAVSLGYGYAIAPSVSWFTAKHSDVAKVPFEDVRRKRFLYLKWPENAVLSQAVKLFRDYLVEHFRKVAPFSGERTKC